MFKQNLIVTLIFSFIIFTIAGCSDSSTSVDDSVAVIQGTVEDNGSQAKEASAESNAEQAVVAAARVNANGSVDIISETETQADASGQFTLEIDADIASQIVIVAETESETRMGFVATTIENGNNYRVKPLDSESTAETEIYVQLIADGNAELVHKSDIEAAVNAHTGARIVSNSSAISHISAGLSNTAEARAEFIGEFHGNANAALDQYFDMMTEIQLQYESDISGNVSTGERDTAFEAFLDAKVNAYTEAGVDLSTIAKMGHMKVNVMQNSISSASSEVRSSVKSSTSIFAAVAIDKAMQARAESAGLAQATVSAIADAGVTLRGEVKGSAGASAQVEAAFETYHEEVRSAIESDSSVEASAVLLIDTEINTVGGAKLNFESSLSGVISSGTLLDVYLDFFSSVHSIVDTHAELIGDIEAEALAEMMIFINLFS